MHKPRGCLAELLRRSWSCFGLWLLQNSSDPSVFIENGSSYKTFGRPPPKQPESKLGKSPAKQAPVIIPNNEDSIENVNMLAIIYLLSSLNFVVCPVLNPLAVTWFPIQMYLNFTPHICTALVLLYLLETSVATRGVSSCSTKFKSQNRAVQHHGHSAKGEYSTGVV